MPRPDRAEQADLVARAIRGDEDAFERLYASYRALVLAAVRPLVPEGEAEDAMQAAFLRIHRKMGSFRGDADFGTWCHRLAVNTALSARRGLKARLKRETVSLDGDGRAEFNALAEPAGLPIESRVAVGELVAWMDLLPEIERRALLLLLEGRDFAEAAEALGKTQAATKSVVHRARKRLRALVEDGRGGGRGDGRERALLR